MKENAETAFKKRLGRRLAKLRKDAGFTQATLAERVGLVFESVSRHERGHTLLGLSRLYDISKALKVEMREFFPAELAVPEREDALNELTDLLRVRPTADIYLVVETTRATLARIDEAKRVDRIVASKRRRQGPRAKQ